MSTPAEPVAPVPARRLGRVEFIALMGTIFATVAFSIDAMLPALPAIAAELTPDAVNRAQLILTSFVLGMGLGTFVVGPLSDAWGRKTVILLGAVLYMAGAALALVAPSLELILAARVIQGLGAAEFWVYFIWTVGIFATAAFTIGNLNALALEPLGHIAGTASSLMGALATIGGALGGAALGQVYNGTPVPLAIGAGMLLTTGALVMRNMPRELPSAR